MTATIAPATTEANGATEAEELREQLAALHREYQEHRENAERNAQAALEQAAELGRVQRELNDANARNEAILARFNRTNDRLTEVIRERDSQTAEAWAKVRTAEVELAQFKDRVVEVALEMARRHSLCSVVQETLVNELGLELPAQTYTVTVEFTVRATALNYRNQTAGYLRRSIDGAELELDSDWESVEVTNYEVTDVEELDD